MSQKVHMDIQISIKDENADTILEDGMNRINQAAEEKLQWEMHKNGSGYKTECDIYEKDIMPTLKSLIKAYPRLDIYALYMYDIREDDSSAQWWRTIQIQTEHHPDGTTTLGIDSSTNWF